jgi:hypothetical protein
VVSRFKKTEIFWESHFLQTFHRLLIYVGQNTFVYKTSVHFPISFDFFSWIKVLYVYNQAQNVVSFDTGFTIHLRTHKTLDCGDAVFAKLFAEKLPVNHSVLNAWAFLMELKSSITLFTRVRLCTVSWVNTLIPHFSRTENYYRVCAGGMSLFNMKQKTFDVRHLTIRYFRFLTSKDESTKSKYFFSPVFPDLRKNIIFLKVPMFLPVVLQGPNVDKNEYGVLIERCGKGKNRSAGRTICPTTTFSIFQFVESSQHSVSVIKT